MEKNKNLKFFTTRVLGPEDKHLVSIMEIIEVRTQKNAWTLQSLCECFSDIYKIIGLFAGNNLIGFSVIYNTKFCTDLLSIGIDPDYQGRKLGSMLLKATLQEALNCEVKECFLEVRRSNLVAQNLYKKFGFKITGVRREYYSSSGGEPAEDAFTMHLENIDLDIAL
ncbi:MAG: ribosomal protein S18-alanine N-acetyltransferase [Succinatimonas sp.]|nr:ribosomal protein S18-alanine N-acetyltransferase [Succinatimonas sp.]